MRLRRIEKRLLPTSLALTLGAATLLAQDVQPSASQAFQPSRPPVARGGDTENVLVVVLDDVGKEMLQSYGLFKTAVSTPTIDALAQSGVVFTDAWSNPTCSPTRAALQTGRYSFRTGLGEVVHGQDALSTDEVLIPAMLDLGTGGRWSHAAFGKWHLGSTAAVGGLDAPNLMGYEHFAGSMGNLKAPESYFAWNRVENGVSSVSTNYATTQTVDDALEWMAAAKGPWFCLLAFNAPHDPFHEPPSELHGQDLSTAGPPEVDPRPYYEAMIEAVDTEIGRLLSSPTFRAVEDRTTIILLSDNGTPKTVAPTPQFGAKLKGSLHEGGISVPLIVSGPRVAQPGTQSSALVHVVDVFATVADIAGVDLDATLPAGRQVDGRSLVPFLENTDASSEHGSLLSEAFLPNLPGAGLPVPFDPNPNLCQSDLGLGGPGVASLTLCGPVLAWGNEATLQVSGAAPNAFAGLVLAATFEPVPFMGGLLGAWPVLGLSTTNTDAGGNFSFPVEPSIKLDAVTLYYQAVVLDRDLIGGAAITNVVAAEFQPYNLKAIRNQRWKLISSVNGGPDEFYDLRSDPFELVNVLETHPDAVAVAAYNTLKAELAAMLSSR